MVRIDLHTHSRASDGTQAPAELVRAAAAAGLDVLALTDHDTAAGWSEAAEEAGAAGITLVRGHGDQHPARLPRRAPARLPAGPDVPPAGRGARPDPGGTRLPGAGDGRPAAVARHRDHLDDVRRASGSATATGRPHVADALVTLGVVADRDEAFALFLSAGRPAYANRYAAPLAETIDLVAAAGGVTVIAHPWGRHERTTLDEAALASLADRGLAGLEVDHQDHDAETRDRLRSVARNLGLVATGSSDHHGAGKVGHDLGCNTTDPDEFARLLELADAAAVASGRAVPEVVARPPRLRTCSECSHRVTPNRVLVWSGRTTRRRAPRPAHPAPRCTPCRRGRA